MKNSIYKKIKSRTLIMTVTALSLLTLIAGVGLFIVRQETLTASDTLGNSAANDSKQALIDFNEESLLRLVENKAALSDEKLSTTIMRVRQMSHAATAAYSLFNDREEALAALRELTLSSITATSQTDVSCYFATEYGEFVIAATHGAQPPEGFDPRPRPWYINAKESNALIWTDVYEDAEGRGLGITCALPFYGPDGEIAGVAGVGAFITDLHEIVVGTQIGVTGYAFMLNAAGEIIIAEDLQRDEDGHFIRENLLEDYDPDMRDIAARMVNGESGIEQIVVDGIEKFIAFHALETVPWSIAAVIDVDEVIAPALKSESSIIDLKQSALNSIDNIIFFISLAVVAALLTVVLWVLRASDKLARGITKPISELTEGAVHIGEGDLEHLLDIKTGDELETLSDTFNTMIHNIKSIAAEKERIGAELDVATKIQASMLPCIFPAFPDRSEFDIYATMIPAKEVGGDFYDFFLINDDTLAVVMADVSGKGVPAALFMVIAKTLLKNNAQYGKSPKEVFEAVNSILCENNEECMFVTAFMGYLDIPSGRFTYVNAGHNQPLLKRAGGKYEWLETDPGFMLAGMEGMEFVQDEIALSKDDELFLYTDGVTEAMNHQAELFSDPRLLDTANAYQNLTLKSFTEQIKSEIDKFADGAEQADDITMLVLRIKGGA
jgi:sigma-B regulation protein RsbU (phosphoserine phosphatase)